MSCAITPEQIALFQAVVALVQKHSFKEVQNTLTLIAPVCQLQLLNADYCQREACLCVDCRVQRNAEMQRAEQDFQRWQAEQEKIPDEFDAEELKKYLNDDYETTNSLFD